MAQQPRGASLPLPALVDRLTWGKTPAELGRAHQLGALAYIEAQLKPAPESKLPPEVQRRIDALSISTESAEDALIEVRRYQVSIPQMSSEKEKTDIRQSIKKITYARTADTRARAIWRALYSPNQLQEQLVWFWMNHFNVYAARGSIGAILDDYEERTIRPRVLGKFRDLLKATITSPAMMLYLDNHRNRAGHLNENYARELMELHTLGVQGGYSQEDVQALARVLTGLGVSYNLEPPKVKPVLRPQLVKKGAFLFHPAYHDYGDKVLLGQRIKGRGMTEVDEAVEMLARHPSTARHISRKLAQYFVADEPSRPMIDAMAKTFQETDGDIAATLRTMFLSDAFAKSLEIGKFKDPTHYVYSSLRLAYASLSPVVRVDVVSRWLARMGQPLYGRLTPDGYPLGQSDWSSSGQMTVRFDLARQIVTNPQSFYAAREDKSKPRLPSLPQLSDTYEQKGLESNLSASTWNVIRQAKSVQDANMYLLSSPEFMRR